MTRDQLIAKRKKKKRFHRVAAGAAVVALVFMLIGAIGIVRKLTGNMPGSGHKENLTEVTGIVDVQRDSDRIDSASGVPEGDHFETTSEGVFYFYADGTMAIGLTPIDGSLYYFGYDGVLLTGWQEDDGNSYYFSPEDGKAVVGEHEIDGKTYWFDENGVNDPSKTVDPNIGKGPMVALTFDDGPGYYTNEILDLLQQYDAKATFFMLGTEVENYKSAVWREHEMGMEQGNHSWDHKTLTHLSGEEIANEFQKMNDALSEVTGEEAKLFRAPGGGINGDVYANSLGMKSILWSIDTLDWETKNAQQTYDTVINNIKDGDIVLMHEIYEATLNALKMLLPKLKEMGYQMVTVSELAAARGVTLEDGVSYYAFYPDGAYFSQ